MRKWLDRYYGRLRTFKANYVLLNLMNPRRLTHARRMFRKYGITRSPLLPIDSSALPAADDRTPWLDRPDAQDRLLTDPRLKDLSRPVCDGILQWPDKGYMILRSLFTEAEVGAVNNEIDRLVRDGVVDFNFTGRKIMFAYRRSEAVRRMATDRRILDVLDLLLGRHMKLFQTINFLTGSEQAAHSDTIHMTTHPLGYLAAAWVALEPMTEENGPLIYYPGSHKLPYILNPTFDHGGGTFTIGEDAYAHYEVAVAKAITEHRLRPETFLARPGDVLIWHANLLHGGKRMTAPNASRKSMAAHYFADDVLCYHELTQRVAWMEEDPAGA
ncbi:MAG: phytanoyl-CoA dioxygenase family protein [Flavobacteriales bacterium]|nr:phytanoyl-CoA dioxygenase family protein [Flavobacteriales bacterium]MCB9194338.1 phytanoyl-CoA dioxygenase family protein [Flavobacteriales bacterium]